MKKNKGYTLVETLIVIAIMAIMTGVAVVTLGIIHQAKYNAAINTFENQMSSLWIKTKAISQGKEQTSPLTSDAQSTYPLCMLVKEASGGGYDIILGFNDGTDVLDQEIMTTLTDLITIKYTESAAAQRHAVLTSASDTYNTEQMLIEFNKADGTVRYGAGDYEVFYNEKLVGTIHLDAVTGNHYVK